jgi:hypothetical protein
LFESLEGRKAELMFQELNKVTGGKPRATRRSSGGRRVILKALICCASVVEEKLSRKKIYKIILPWTKTLEHVTFVMNVANSSLISRNW